MGKQYIFHEMCGNVSQKAMYTGDSKKHINNPVWIKQMLSKLEQQEGKWRGVYHTPSCTFSTRLIRIGIGIALYKLERKCRAGDSGLVATRVPKGFRDLTGSPTLLISLSLPLHRYAIRPPQGWECMSAAIRRERACGNDTEQCPHFMGMYARRHRGSVQPLSTATFRLSLIRLRPMARIFHEGSLVRLLGLGNYGETGGVLE